MNFYEIYPFADLETYVRRFHSSNESPLSFRTISRLIPQTILFLSFFFSVCASIELFFLSFFTKRRHDRIDSPIILQTPSVLCCRLHGLRTPRRKPRTERRDGVKRFVRPLGTSLFEYLPCYTRLNVSRANARVLSPCSPRRRCFLRFSFGDFFLRGLSVYLELLAGNVRVCQFYDEREFKMFLLRFYAGNASK